MKPFSTHSLAASAAASVAVPLPLAAEELDPEHSRLDDMTSPHRGATGSPVGSLPTDVPLSGEVRLGFCGFGTRTADAEDMPWPSPLHSDRGSEGLMHRSRV